MKVALFGRNGQVATEIQRRAPKGTLLTVFDRETADFTKPDQVYDRALRVDADAVVNAVAYTAVDKAENDRETARVVNATSVDALARACAEIGKPLVHISTDYVFPDRGEAPRMPGDPTGPINVYGATKLAGEEAIRRAGARHAILRTSWVFSAHGANFVKSMLKHGAKGAPLGVVDDQVGGPTPAAAIADACLALAKGLYDGASGGTYHFAGTPNVSWAEFAREIFKQRGMQVEVVGIPTKDYPTDAKRPLNSRLNCDSLARDFGITQPDWRIGLGDVLRELAK